MMELLHQFKHNFFDPEGLKELLSTAGGVWPYAILFAIVFIETGLFFCLLPGDSLLFMAGVVAGTGALNFWLVIVLMCIAAIGGDTAGYWIGAKMGKALFNMKDRWFFKREHLVLTQQFYDKHGRKTIILARFVPIVRTFAPVVAGIGNMQYRTFISYNVFGGIGWVISMTTLGLVLGSREFVQRNLEKMVLLIVFISILPGIIEFLRHRAASKAGNPGAAPASRAAAEADPPDGL